LKAPDDEVLTLWTIYDHPLDFPGSFVVRKWHVLPRNKEPMPDGFPTLHDSLEAARESLPPGLTRLPPSEGDALAIVETWI
jgi:hypothetical protein